jgi:DNA-binding SARP family transcriptional activator
MPFEPRVAVGTRRNVIERLVGSTASLVAFLAPAGYGKTSLARSYGLTFKPYIHVDAGRTGDMRAILAEIGAALGGEYTAWSTLATGSCIVVDNADALDDSALLYLLEALLDVRPAGGHVVICSAREPAFSLIELLEPRAVIALRAHDFALSLESLRAEIPEGTTLDPTLLLRVLELSNGWPLVANHLLHRALDGHFARDLKQLRQGAWADIFDWVETQVVSRLDRSARLALFEAVARMDVLIEDFEDPELRRAAMRLLREYQLADIGIVNEIRIAPFLRLFLHVRHWRELNDAADRVFEQERERAPVRAARAMINVGNLQRAETLLAAQDDPTIMTLGDYAYPGVLLEDLTPIKQPYHFYPHVWLGLSTARSFTESPATLAQESSAVCARLEDQHDRHTWALWSAGICQARAGQLDEARASAQQLMTACSDLKRSTMLELLQIMIDAAIGNYASAIERWQRCSRQMLNQSAVYALALPTVARCMLATGEIARAGEHVRLITSLTRLVSSPFVYIAALIEATALAWITDDESEFVRQREELARTLLAYEAPTFRRYTAATFGYHVNGTAPGDPFFDTLALVTLAAGSTEGSADYASAAIRSADAGLHPWLRCCARVVAAVRNPAQREDALAQALTIAAQVESRAMQDALDRLAGNDESAGVFTAIAERVRRSTFQRRSSAPSTPQYPGIVLDVAAGLVTRDGRALKVSAGTFALIVCLAVNRDSAKREVLIDALWPDLDADSALSALKMCVHRARAQLGDPETIVVGRGTYALGPGMRSNMNAIAEYASEKLALPLSEQQRAQIAHLFAALLEGGGGAWATWSWFAPHAQRLSDCAARLGDALVRDALAREEPHAALQVARAMCAAQPLDELPRLLVIRCHLAAHNRARALEEYRAYREIARKELGIEPSEQFDALLAGAATATSIVQD